MSGYAIESLAGRGGNKVLKIDGKKIADEDRFHDVFASALGFPDFYGRNMNAWNDCLSSIDIPEDGLSQVHVDKGGTLTIHIENYKHFKRNAPKQWESLLECTSFVNFCRIENGQRPLLALSFFN